MTGEQCFEAWAPEESPWSPWTRPVLFVLLDELQVAQQAMDLSSENPLRLPTAHAGLAVIVDLPGAQSVRTGLLLAQRGFRPVPLFNATSGPSPVVDVRPVAQAVVDGVPELRAARLRADAPPAFLVDSDRMRPAVTPGKYDNRWVVLPQDFPSGTFLLSRGIREVAIVQRGTGRPGDDLAHVLLRWQEAGIRLRQVDLVSDSGPTELQVHRPRMYRRAWHVAISLMGLRRSNVGGFGARVPEQTTGGGYGAMGGFG